MRAPINKMPTRSVGKPVGKRVGRSTPTTSTPTRKTTSASSAANPYQRAYQRAAGKRQEGIKPSNYQAQTRRPPTSSRS